jgi:hypothetical protein
VRILLKIDLTAIVVSSICVFPAVLQGSPPGSRPPLPEIECSEARRAPRQLVPRNETKNDDTRRPELRQSMQDRPDAPRPEFRRSPQRRSRAH